MGIAAEDAPELIRVPVGLHPLLAVRPPKSQHATALRALGLGMVSGTYPEGTLLPGDAELQRRLSVSRTVLREAMKTLSAKGMVQAKAKTGTRVLERRHWNFFDADILYWHLEAGVGSRFLGHLSEMRLVFEPEAAALAAERRNEENLAEMQHWLDLMRRSSASLSDFVEGDLRFHQAIAAASGNPLMRSIGSIIEVALAMTFTISSPQPEQHEATVARHRAVVDAIRSGDAGQARIAMRAVILEGMRRVSGRARP